jgi:glucan phosphoethanolaminetransferase (alkaline phosphatase superfamily)
LLALANASLGSTVLTFFKEHWIEDWNGYNGSTSQFEVQVYAFFAAGLMGALTIGAFVLLSLVVVAFSAIVGWIALGFTAFYGLVIAVGVLHQFPWPWRSNTPISTPRHTNSLQQLGGKSRTL